MEGKVKEEEEKLDNVRWEGVAQTFDFISNCQCGYSTWSSMLAQTTAVPYKHTNIMSS